jgi:hypothetical protein
VSRGRRDHPGATRTAGRQRAAGLPRDDLLVAGFGNGHHGFAQPLDLASLSPATPLHVRVHGTVWEVPGSGQLVADLAPPMAAAPTPPEPATEPAADPAPAIAVAARPPRGAARRGLAGRSNGQLPHANGGYAG